METVTMATLLHFGVMEVEVALKATYSGYGTTSSFYSMPKPRVCTTPWGSGAGILFPARLDKCFGFPAHI